jgi:hypothetical protein
MDCDARGQVLAGLHAAGLHQPSDRRVRHRHLRRCRRGRLRPAARRRQRHSHHRAGNGTAGDLRSRKLRLSTWTHRGSLSDLPSAGTTRIRTFNRTNGTRRGGGFDSLQSGRLGGLASALGRRPSCRSSRGTGRVMFPPRPWGRPAVNPLAGEHVKPLGFQSGTPHGWAERQKDREAERQRGEPAL